MATTNVRHQSRYLPFEAHRISFGGNDIASVSKARLSWADSRTGGINPHWKEQIKADIQAGTYLSGNIVRIKSRPFAIGTQNVPIPPFVPPSGHEQFNESDGHFSRLGLPSLASASILDEVKANNKALTQFVNKVRRHQTSFQGIVSVGELSRTLRLIKNPVNSLRRGIGGYLNSTNRLGRRSKSLTPKKVSEILADTWLEHSFGWQPLLGEIDDGMKTIADHSFNVDNLRKMATGVGVESSVVHGGPIPVGFTGPPFFATPLTTSKVVVKYYGSVRAGGFAANAPNTRTGFAPTNWAPAAWELLPYSFLVDYFANIGDIINAASLASSSLRWTMKTVIKEVKVDLTNWQAPELNDTLLYRSSYSYVVPGTFSMYRRTVRREPYSGSLVPSLEFSIPNSGTRWLNVAAIVLAGKRAQRLFRT